MPKWIETDQLDIGPNEYAFSLSELNLHPDGAASWRRHQVIMVPRGETLVRCSRDLGPAEGFIADEFRIQGGVFTDDGKFEGIHTVGELVEEATAHRHRLAERITKKLEEPKVPAPLDEMYYEAQDDYRASQRANPRTGERRRWYPNSG